MFLIYVFYEADAKADGNLLNKGKQHTKLTYLNVMWLNYLISEKNNTLHQRKQYIVQWNVKIPRQL